MIAGLAAAAAAEEVLVQRTMLPECGPSSFAVALPGGLGFSYDPGRGGVNYVWRGGFVDLGPTWKAKINHPATVPGPIVYREQARFPLRLRPGAGEPVCVFRGYVLLPDGVEFHYLLDGVPLREEIRPAPGGGGLVRTFRTDTAVPGWSYLVEAQPGVRLSAPAGGWNEARTALTAPGGRAFTLRLDLEEPRP